MSQVLPERIPDQLPDFRNLGVMMRILISVNVMSLVAALGGADTLLEAIRRYTTTAAFLEPALVLSVMSGFVVNRWLSRLPYWQGVVLCLIISFMMSWGARFALRELETTTVLDWTRTGLWGMGICWLILGYFRLRSRALSPLLTEARLQALQARIRPHFLFNSINAVLSLIRSEPRKAERALEDLADLFRVFMADNRDLSTLQREIELARQYLSIEQLRLGERLRIEWHIDKMPADAKIPPLVLQPLLENAVYHGIEPSSVPGVISINVFRVRDQVHIDIRNPYLPDGGKHHAGNKMAMANIRERLFLHFDAEAQLKTTVGSDYYQIHLALPHRDK